MNGNVIGNAFETNELPIYSVDFFKEKIFSVHVSYDITGDKESFNLQFTDIKNKTVKCKLYEDNVLSSWLSFFDLDRYENDILFIRKIESYYKDVSVVTHINQKYGAGDSNCNVSDILLSLSIIDIENIINSVIYQYKEYVQYHPFYLMHVNLIYTCLHNLYMVIEHGDKAAHFNFELFVKADKTLLEEVNKTKTYYNDFREYILNSIAAPIEKGIVRKPSILLLNYERFLNYINRENCVKNLLFENAKKDVRYEGLDYGIWLNAMELIESPVSVPSSSQDTVSVYYNDSLFILDDNDFSECIINGINYLTEMDYVLKKCPNCKRYFLTKYNSATVYCNRKYRSTKETCQEYASHAKYRVEQANDPVKSEFRKAYNRVYARVKRGVLDMQDARLAELIALRNKYVEMYDLEEDEVNRKFIRDEVAEIINEKYK